MIFYPIETLVKAGIKDILIIIAPEYAGHFLHLLGSGKDFGARFSYEIQEEPRGLAEAFIIGENFIGKSAVTMILGDNIFDHDFGKSIKNFHSGGRIFAKKVDDPERFGVVEFNSGGRVISIEEKPTKPKSDYAVVGMYVYDSQVVELAKKVTPSGRGELEITDLNRLYLERGELEVELIEGMWEDAGTFDSLLRVSLLMQQRRLAEND